MNITETVISVIISYMVVCATIAFGVVVGFFLDWLARILD